MLNNAHDFFIKCTLAINMNCAYLHVIMLKTTLCGVFIIEKDWRMRNIGIPKLFKSVAKDSLILLEYVNWVLSDFKYLYNFVNKFCFYSSYLAYLSWKLKWAILVTFYLSFVCPSFLPSVNFSDFQHLL